MRGLRLVIVVMFGMVIGASAQLTTTTATVQDSDGTVWANGTYTVVYQNSVGGSPSIAGQPVCTLMSVSCSGPPQRSGSLNSSGQFSFTLGDTALINPTGATWKFTICPNVTSPTCGTVSVPVTGGSQSVSTQINAAISPPRVTGVGVPSAYADVEVSSATYTIYFRLSDSTFRCWNGSAWAACGSSITNAYQTIQSNGSAQTQRTIVNFISGTNATVACVDNSGATRTDCTISASSTAGSQLSAITAATGANSINNADNAQTWNWSLTTASKTGFGITENVASTATGTPILHSVATLATSTANPFQVTAGGTSNGWRVNTSGNLVPLGTGAIAVGGTAHGVVISEGSTTGVTTLGVAALDTLLMGGGAGADPAFTAAPAGGTNGCAGTTDTPTYNSTTHTWGCHQISGSGTVNAGTANQIAYYATTGSAVSGNTRLTDNGTTLAYSGTGGMQLSSSSAGFLGLAQGTAQSTVANTIGLTAPTSVTAYNLVYPTAGGSGFIKFTNSSGIVTGAFQSFPDLKIIPAANCVSATAGAAWNTSLTPTCIGGTNNLGGYLPFVDTSTGQFEFELPTDWDTTQQPFISVFFNSGTNATGTVIFNAAAACTKSDGSITSDPAFTTADALATKTMTATARQWSTSTQLTQVTSGNNCVPGGTILVKITRATDTAASAVQVTKATITIPRLTVVQAD